MKMQNQMKWVCLMNNIKAWAEEIVLQKLMYMEVKKERFTKAFLKNEDAV